MKKKLLIILIVIFVIMLIPVPIHIKDGGSVEYKALLYKYTKIHRLNENSSTGYEDGWKLEILGFDVGEYTDLYVSQEHIISIRSTDKKINAVTGSFCYREGVCIDKIHFADFTYDVMPTYYGNKLYIDNIGGAIKSIKLFNYSTREFTNEVIEYKNEYIVTPSVSGVYIIDIGAIYQGKMINYYFMVQISKISGDEVNVDIKLKEDTLTNESLTMIVNNLSDKSLQYGNPYKIEKFVNGYWITVKPIKDIAFTLPAYHLDKNDSIELNINWKDSYGKLKGKYRIVKEFAYNENDNFVFFNKYLEFEFTK